MDADEVINTNTSVCRRFVMLLGFSILMQIFCRYLEEPPDKSNSYEGV